MLAVSVPSLPAQESEPEVLPEPEFPHAPKDRTMALAKAIAKIFFIFILEFLPFLMSQS